MPHFTMFNGGKSDLSNPINDEYNGNYVIEISQAQLYAITSIISLLLIINIISLSYYNCCKRKQTRPYSKVAQIVSSDDDIQNLKEYEI